MNFSLNDHHRLWTNAQTSNNKTRGVSVFPFSQSSSLSSGCSHWISSIIFMSSTISSIVKQNEKRNGFTTNQIDGQCRYFSFSFRTVHLSFLFSRININEKSLLSSDQMDTRFLLMGWSSSSSICFEWSTEDRRHRYVKRHKRRKRERERQIKTILLRENKLTWTKSVFHEGNSFSRVTLFFVLFSRILPALVWCDSRHN